LANNNNITNTLAMLSSQKKHSEHHKHESMKEDMRRADTVFLFDPRVHMNLSL
jgi:CRP-like cAMP-binding protein